jgi:hypothetical protein
MGRPFKIKARSNVKATKKTELDIQPMNSPYVKDKPTKVLPVFFNFNDQWEPNESPLIINDPSTLWDGPVYELP